MFTEWAIPVLLQRHPGTSHAVSCLCHSLPLTLVISNVINVKVRSTCTTYDGNLKPNPHVQHMMENWKLVWPGAGGLYYVWKKGRDVTMIIVVQYGVHATVFPPDHSLNMFGDRSNGWWVLAFVNQTTQFNFH